MSILLGQNVESAIIPILYDDLLNLFNNSALIPGEQYLITDYVTTYIQPDTEDSMSGTTEPILVTAQSVNALEPIAYSTLFPSDILYYHIAAFPISGEVPYDGIIGETKGFIYRRIDTYQNNDLPFDFRQVQFYYSGGYFGSSGNNYFFPPNNYSNCYNNIFSNNFSEYQTYALYNFNNICFNSMNDNIIGSQFKNNRFSQLVSSNIGNYFQNNTFEFIANSNIGDSFSGNTIGIEFNSNTIGHNANNNTIGDYFQYNIIGNNFQYNNTVSGFSNNNLTNGSLLQNINGITFSSATYMFNTWTYWLQQMSAATLPISEYICITDASGTDMGAIIKTNAYGNGFENETIGYFLNADFQGIGNYSMIGNLVDGASEGSLRGVWATSSESGYSNNDICIWNCSHYVVINNTAVNGTSPDGNTSAYTILPKSAQISGYEIGYILEADKIDYDFINNAVIYRYDTRGNKINNDSLNNFQFGDNSIIDCIQNTQYSYIYNFNNTGNITGIESGIGSYIYIPQNTNSIYFIVDGPYITLYAPNNSGTIEAHLHGFDAGFESSNNSGNILAYIYNYAYAMLDYNSGEIWIRMYDASVLYSEFNAGQIQYGVFMGGSNINLSLSSGFYHNQCVYSNNAGFIFPGTSSFSDCVLSELQSTFTATVDITGLTTLDVIGTNNWSGNFIITSSNSTESITDWANIENNGFPITIIPNIGLTLSIVSTSANSPVTSTFILQNGTASLVGRSDFSAVSIPGISDYIVVKENSTSSGVVRQIGGSILS